MQHFGHMNSIVCAEVAIGRPVVSDMPWLSRNVLQASFDVVTVCHLSTCCYEWNVLLAAPSRAAKFSKRMEHNTFYEVWSLSATRLHRHWSRVLIIEAQNVTTCHRPRSL